MKRNPVKRVFRLFLCLVLLIGCMAVTALAEEAHIYKTEWNPGNVYGHWHDCSNCDAHSEQETHIPNVDFATQETARYCTVCGYVIEEQLAAGEITVVAQGLHDGGPVKWKVTSDGVLTISGKKSIQGKQSYAWKEYSDIIRRIVVEDGITTVPAYAFSEMPNVSSVYLGNKVKYIDKYAFEKCDKLYDITIPANLEEIRLAAFFHCDGLVSVKFADGGKLQTIGTSAFASTGLTELVTPSYLKTIGQNAFENCAFLRKVYLSSGLEMVHNNAFLDCSAMKTLYISETVKSMYSQLDGCTALEKVENYSPCSLSFKDFKNLKTVVLAGEATGVGCLEGCSALTDVTLGEKISSIGDNAFMGCTALETLTLPDSVGTIGDDAFRDCTALKTLTLSDALARIGARAFAGCTSLETLTLPDTVQEIEAGAFTGCTALKTMTLPAALQKLAHDTFADCTGLETVILQEGVKEIEYLAFTGCSALKTLVLPDSIEKFGDRTFNGCTSLTTLTLPKAMKVIGAYVFNNSSLTSLTIPETVEEIESAPFDNSAIKTVTFLGNAPVFNEKNSFAGFTGTVLYHGNNPTWTEDKLQNYGGEVTWVDMDNHPHEYEEETVAPTCTQPGYTTYTCFCGHSYVGANVDALGHTPGEAWNKDNRNHWKTCTVGCGVMEETKAAHAAADGSETCDTCGFPMADVQTGLTGDANGDGKVLANDAMLVLQYSVGAIKADKLETGLCDVSGDGKVLANDAMLILQYSVGAVQKFPVEK